jgi:hypothetical protein
VQSVQSKLDAANGTLGHIYDCFKQNVDPNECAIFAKRLTAETLSAKPTTYTPTYAGALIGLSIDEQRDMVSNELFQLAGAIREDYKSKILDPRDQRAKAAEDSMRQLIAAGETPQAARGQAYGSPGSDRQRQLNEASIMSRLLITRLPQIRTAVQQAGRLVPESDSSFMSAKQAIRIKCTIDIPDANAEWCADSLTDLATLIKPRQDL